MTLEPFTLPLDSPFSTASGRIEARSGFVVRYDHRGRTGIGEATPLPGWTESLDDCESALRDALAASETAGHEAGLLELEMEDVPAARHGFATALLDADARAEGSPLYRWLGADRRRESIPVNATIGDGDVETTVSAANSAVEAGFECLKFKVGARDLDADVERVRAVRQAVADEIGVRLDANGAWDRNQAGRAFDDFASLNVGYVEQPLPAGDLAGLRELRGGSIGVAIDETLVERRIADVLDADAADVVILKPMVLGGPGTAHTLATRIREAGVEPVLTTTVDGVVARTAAVHVAAALPDVSHCGLATADLLAEDLGPDPAPVSDGEIAVPQGPGLGIDPSEVSP